MSERVWYTVADVAGRLHLARITTWRLLRPYRARCHLARNGSHPRLLLWVPVAVVERLEAERRWLAPTEGVKMGDFSQT